MQKIKAWVHHWVLARIPEQHQHLAVNDVDKGDIDDLFVKVYGLAARDPKRYCKAIKTRMKSLPLDFRSSNLMAHQWVLDQYEYFDAIQDAKCDGTYKVPECDFVDLVVDALEPHMPKLAFHPAWEVQTAARPLPSRLGNRYQGTEKHTESQVLCFFLEKNWANVFVFRTLTGTPRGHRCFSRLVSPPPRGLPAIPPPPPPPLPGTRWVRP
jgi:hypothetical protein